MPFRNRGIVKPPRKFAGAKGPRPPRAPSLQHKAPGAPPTPRSAPIDQTTFAVVPPPPSNWFGPATEWACWWFLTTKRGYVPNVDFAYQAAVGTTGAPGGPTNSKGFLRVDFWLFTQGRHGPMGYPYTNGLIWNPISPFTHPSIAKDRLERAVLATLGYLVIYIDVADLEARPLYVLNLALRGVDISSHRS